MTILETSVEQTVELDPQLAARLDAKLSTYRAVQQEIDALEIVLKSESVDIMELMEEHGIERCRVNGAPVSIVRGTSSSLDKLKFVELGGSLEMLANATVHKPKRAFLKVGDEKSE